MNYSNIPAALAVSALFLTTITVTTPAFAIKGDHQRYQTCQNLKGNGSVNWHGIATGTIDTTFEDAFFGRTFHTKACFSNERECRTWVKRIWWEIPTMNELHNAFCQRK